MWKFDEFSLCFQTLNVILKWSKQKLYLDFKTQIKSAMYLNSLCSVFLFWSPDMGFKTLTRDANLQCKIQMHFLKHKEAFSEYFECFKIQWVVFWWTLMWIYKHVNRFSEHFYRFHTKTGSGIFQKVALTIFGVALGYACYFVFCCFVLFRLLRVLYFHVFLPLSFGLSFVFQNLGFFKLLCVI